jgi:hypothetical protein
LEIRARYEFEATENQFFHKVFALLSLESFLKLEKYRKTFVRRGRDRDQKMIWGCGWEEVVDWEEVQELVGLLMEMRSFSVKLEELCGEEREL